MNTRGLVALLACGALAIAALEPIPQDPAYHDFADKRRVLGIANGWNVLSNLPFIAIGLAGLYHCRPAGHCRLLEEIRNAYRVFFLAVALTGLGSAYYHLAPDHTGLFWDRLAMAPAMMALCAIVVGEFISARTGRRLLWPLVLLGMASVVYWYLGERRGAGDLRPYVAVQFLPMPALALLLWRGRSIFSHTHAYGWLLLAYLLAKVCEHYDLAVFRQLGWISGHSLKHLAAAAGLALLLRAYLKRSRL